MSERIGRLNGATRAEKHDCDDEQVFHDGLLVVVTQKDDGFDALWHPLYHGASACRADFDARYGRNASAVTDMKSSRSRRNANSSYRHGKIPDITPPVYGSVSCRSRSRLCSFEHPGRCIS